MVNAPFDNFGHIDGFYCERKHTHDKANNVFLDDASVDWRRKIGLNECLDVPRGQTLKIVEGEDFF